MPPIERPHFEFPFRRGGPRRTVVCVEQDTTEHIESCCAMIAACPSGFRQERPEFGWPFPTFRGAPVPTTEVERAILTFEPRAVDVRSEVWLDVAAGALEHMDLTIIVEEDDPNG